MRIKQLKETYEFACNEYVQKFCNKQELTNEGWVNDDVGSIALCSDFYFNLHDIILDINSKQPKGQIIDWYYENLDDPDNFINYHSYIKGLRISDITNNIVGQSEQLMQSCSVCGMTKHPILGAHCKASNCPHEH